MLNESRLYNFISPDKKFSLQFLEGQKLINDLALVHSIKKEGFAYFRDITLSTQPLMALLKNTESFGIYIDSELPYFRYKVEMSHSGDMRTLMLPHEFDESPTELTGICRLAKTTPNNQHPYTSIIELDKIGLKELTNQILSQSYQIDGEVYVSDYSDQSVLLMKLPSPEEEILSTREEWLKIQKDLLEIFHQALNSEEDVISSIEETGYIYLGSTKVQFKCNCSQERMLQGIRSLARGDLDNVFEGDTQIEVKCDYCNKNYVIERKLLSH